MSIKKPMNLILQCEKYMNQNELPIALKHKLMDAQKALAEDLLAKLNKKVAANSPESVAEENKLIKDKNLIMLTRFYKNRDDLRLGEAKQKAETAIALAEGVRGAV